MPRPGPRTTNPYSDEFKRAALAMSHVPSVAVPDVAATFCIHPFMLSRWRKEAREGRFDLAMGQAADKE
ncbi:MAG: transposase [Gammaproteobacteria bacterium]|nr:transposase [Gammaproteobacteria bacterium]